MGEPHKSISMKQKKFSLLQISDLHKLKGTTYNSLLQTLLADKARIEQEGITPPSFIVVCGDVVHGADTEAKIQSQYAEVEIFLNDLVTHFLNGEKKHMIIVPGNHDMNRIASSASFINSTKTKKKDYEEYKYHNSDLRWNWKLHKYQRIHDQSKYDSRFALFVDFYNRFFAGIRSYPTDPVMEAYTEYFPKENIAFACFNSCHGLDHINTSANIPEEAVDSIAGDLIKFSNDGYLTIGVWHHHFYGSPYQVNYMDKEIFDTMMQFGIGIGLFGHQHLSQVATEITNLYAQEAEEYRRERMLLISSGTLFGGEKELQHGCKRQYNIIEFDMKNGEAEVTVHIREDKNPNINSRLPHWVCKNVNTQGKVVNKVYFKHLHEDEILVNIDHYVRSNSDFVYGCEAINALPQMPKRAQELYHEYLREIKDYESLIRVIETPENADDYFLLISTAKNEGNQSAMSELAEDAHLIDLCQQDSLLKEKYEEMLDLIN